MTLFRSHNPQYVDGGQMRDFVYVKDVVEICFFLLNHRTHSGIYNLGTGQARTFMDLTINTFDALNAPTDIRFRDTPEDIRDKYQYFTEADMRKIRSIGYELPFTSLEDGIRDYVQEYLLPDRFY
jgi:ADP-L-glycero-D-manno-heptose 6-epimerase